MSDTEIREIFFWDWGLTPSGYRLHSVTLDSAREEDWGHWPGVSACGIRGTWEIPGIFDRLGLFRCRRCCEILGLPQGKGSPKNDVVLRELLQKETQEPIS